MALFPSISDNRLKNKKLRRLKRNILNKGFLILSKLFTKNLKEKKPIKKIIVELYSVFKYYQRYKRN